MYVYFSILWPISVQTGARMIKISECKAAISLKLFVTLNVNKANR